MELKYYICNLNLKLKTASFKQKIFYQALKLLECAVLSAECLCKRAVRSLYCTTSTSWVELVSFVVLDRLENNNKNESFVVEERKSFFMFCFVQTVRQDGISHVILKRSLNKRNCVIFLT